MPIPTHDQNCQRTTIPTKCRDCGEEVFYFSCTCGSKVFFDSLGGSWPQHGDSCLPYLVRFNLEEGWRSIREIRELVEETARGLGVGVPERVYRLLELDDARRNNRLQVTQLQPTEDLQPILGTVISITPTVNLLNVFNLQNNAMGQGLLGPLLGRKYSQLRVREEPDDDNNCREFIVYAEHSIIIQQALRQNSSIMVTLTVHSVPGRHSIWVAEVIERA